MISQLNSSNRFTEIRGRETERDTHLVLGFANYKGGGERERERERERESTSMEALGFGGHERELLECGDGEHLSSGIGRQFNAEGPLSTVL